MRDYTKILTIMVTLLMVGSCFILTTNPVVGYEMPPPEIVTCSELDYETETQESTLIAGETVFEVSYTFFEPDISVQNDRCSVTMTDTESYGDPGFPVLPTKTALIALPAGNVLTKVIVSGEIAQIELDLEVAWGQEPTAFGEEPEDDTPKNEFIYESVVPWPTKTFDVRKPMIWRGFNVQPVMLYPARYIPSENLLEYYTLMEVTLVMESLGGDVPDTYRGLEKDFALVGESVDNPSALKTYDEVAEIVQASTLVDPGLDYEYVIITGEEFIDNFTPFIQYKNDIGLKTTLVTVEDIYMNPAYDGIDEPDEIRNFVKDAYSTWGTEYILLGGDVEIVPERGVYLEYSSYVNHDVPCDNYFVSLDGDWNEDGDEVWGEVGEEDWYAELFVGRVTFDQGYELDNWINKTLRYDQGLTNNVDRVLLAGQQLNSYPTWGGNYMDNLQTHFPDDEPWNFTKLYNRDGTFSRQAIIDSLNEGNNLVNHMGHAGYSSNMGLSRSNVDELTNEDPYLIYSQGCMSGAFDDDFSGSDEGICEHHIFSEGGAFGVIMNARYGWYSGSSSGPSQWFHNPFIDALLGDYETSVGEANQYSKDQYVGYYDSYSVYRWIALELNYLGDPALIVNRPYLYEHDVGVTDLYAADMVSLGAEVPVRATLINTGRNAEDVTVEFLADDVLYDSQEITITHGASMLVEFTWEAPEIEGVHTLAIQLVLPEDEEPNNNYAKTIVEIADVVTVDDDGGADYRTISEAVAETEGNKVIYVNPGIYLESVYVDRSLRLQGSRNEMPVVGNVGEDAVFTLAADDIELRGFIMNGCSYGLVFDRCSGCIVEDNTIAKNSNGGVLFEEAVENTLRANTIEDNRMFEGGVGVLMHGSPENLITQNEIRDHADYGIRMDISDSLVIDNYIHDNNYGIWVQSGTAQITENNIRINKRGIGCTEMSYPNIVDNELCGNSWGIYAENGAYPTITDNRFCRCSDGNWVSYAVYLSRSGEVEIVGNDFDDINTGVYLEGSNAIINNNYFYKGYKGVDMRLDSYSIITENIFEENSYGIYSYMGSPMVENNNFDDQRCVYLYNSDDAIIQDNMFDEHYSGILLHESDAIVRDNVLQYGNNGITVWSGAPTLEGNIMNKHESYGLSIDYRAKETISNMSDNLIDGIDASLLYYYNEVDLNLEGYELSGLLTKHGIFTFYDCYDVTVEDCALDGNWYGVYIQNSDVDVIFNSITNCRYSGVYIQDSTGTIGFNEITSSLEKYRMNGIDIYSSTSLIDGNSISGCYYGIRMRGECAGLLLTDNTMDMCRYGITIPYECREVITDMSGNTVNGLDINQVYYYNEDGITINNFDYKGDLSYRINQEGLLTFYDCTNVMIVDCDLGGNGFGVYAYNSELIVRTSSFFDNEDGAHFEHCTVTVKWSSAHDNFINGFYFYYCDIVVRNNVAYNNLGGIGPIYDMKPSEIQFFRGYGIRIYGGSGLVRNNNIYDNYYGIYANYATVDIKYNKVHDNSIGIYIYYMSSTISRNDIYDNRDGLSLYQFTGIASYNWIESNSYGVYLWYGTPTLYCNSISDNYIGVATSYSEAEIYSNYITYNEYNGVHCFYGKEQAVIQNNLIAYNGYNGVYCGYSTSPLITWNYFYENLAKEPEVKADEYGTLGIETAKGSSPTITCNYIYNSGGIICAGSPVIENNFIAGSYFGIMNYGGNPTISNNRITNVEIGYYVHGSDDYGGTFSDNWIYNVETGIRAYGSEFGCYDNTISGCEVGIDVGRGSIIYIEGNTISNAQIGVYVHDRRSGGFLNDNYIYNCEIGVQLMDGADMEEMSNNFIHNVGIGLYAAEYISAEFTGNQIYNADVGVLAYNTKMICRQNEIRYCDVGIELGRGAYVYIDMNVISRNCVGIKVHDLGSIGLARENEIFYNNEGILVEYGASMEIYDNEIFRNWNGVHFVGEGRTYANAVMHNNNIYNNRQYGVWNDQVDTGIIIEATNNWWGDASGPYDPIGNPGGCGDMVSQGVDYSYWLTEPATEPE